MIATVTIERNLLFPESHPDGRKPSAPQENYLSSVEGEAMDVSSSEYLNYAYVEEAIVPLQEACDDMNVTQPRANRRLSDLVSPRRRSTRSDHSIGRLSEHSISSYTFEELSVSSEYTFETFDGSSNSLHDSFSSSHSFGGGLSPRGVSPLPSATRTLQMQAGDVRRIGLKMELDLASPQMRSSGKGISSTIVSPAQRKNLLLNNLPDLLHNTSQRPGRIREHGDLDQNMRSEVPRGRPDYIDIEDDEDASSFDEDEFAEEIIEDYFDHIGGLGGRDSIMLDFNDLQSIMESKDSIILEGDTEREESSHTRRISGATEQMITIVDESDDDDNISIEAAEETTRKLHAKIGGADDSEISASSHDEKLRTPQKAKALDDMDVLRKSFETMNEHQQANHGNMDDVSSPAPGSHIYNSTACDEVNSDGENDMNTSLPGICTTPLQFANGCDNDASSNSKSWIDDATWGKVDSKDQNHNKDTLQSPTSFFESQEGNATDDVELTEDYVPNNAGDGTIPLLLQAEIFDDEFGDATTDDVSASSVDSDFSDSVIEEEARSADGNADQQLQEPAEEGSKIDRVRIFDDEFGNFKVGDTTSPNLPSHPIDVMVESMVQEEDRSQDDETYPHSSKPVDWITTRSTHNFQATNINDSEGQVAEAQINGVIEETEAENVLGTQTCATLKHDWGSNELEIVDDEYGDDEGTALDQVTQDREGSTEIVQERRVGMDIQPLHCATVEELHARSRRRKHVMDALALAMDTPTISIGHHKARTNALSEPKLKSWTKEPASQESGIGDASRKAKLSTRSRLAKSTDQESVRRDMMFAHRIATKHGRQKIVMAAINVAKNASSTVSSSETCLRSKAKDDVKTLRLFSRLATKKGRREIVMRAVQCKTELAQVQSCKKNSGRIQQHKNGEVTSPRQIDRTSKTGSSNAPKEINAQPQNGDASEYSRNESAKSPKRSSKTRKTVKSKSRKHAQRKSSAATTSHSLESAKQKEIITKNSPSTSRKSKAHVTSPKATSPKRTKGGESKRSSVAKPKSPRRSSKGVKRKNGKSPKGAERKYSADLRLSNETVPMRRESIGSASSKQHQTTSFPGNLESAKGIKKSPKSLSRKGAAAKSNEAVPTRWKSIDSTSSKRHQTATFPGAVESVKGMKNIGDVASQTKTSSKKVAPKRTKSLDCRSMGKSMVSESPKALIRKDAATKSPPQRSRSDRKVSTANIVPIDLQRTKRKGRKVDGSL